MVFGDYKWIFGFVGIRKLVKFVFLDWENRESLKVRYMVDEFFFWFGFKDLIV